MKAYGGSGCKYLDLHDLGTSWRLVVSFTPPDALPAGKNPHDPLDRRLVDPRAGVDDKEKLKFLILPELEVRPLGRLGRSQSLYRLCYHDEYYVCQFPKTK
jgi:hypothetical protein